MKKLIVGLLGITVIGTGCSRTEIVFKPSRFLDPMPLSLSDLNAAEVDTKGLKKNDPLRGEQWNLSKVGADKNKGQGNGQYSGNANIKIALLSTGVDYNHEDLVGKISVNLDEIVQDGAADKPGGNLKDDDDNSLVDDIVGYDVVDSDGLAYDRHGAGTAVAGIIAATAGNGKGIAGIMDKVSIYPVRYINNNGQATLGHLLEGIDIALKSDPQVIYIQNVHLHYGGHSMDPKVIAAEMNLLKSKLAIIEKKKIPVVIGAGDDMDTFSSEEVEQVIRRFSNIIIVTSTDKVDELAFLAKHSRKYVHTAAPGEEILTTQPLNKYAKVSGTAYAAAHVTAAIALAKSEVGPGLTIDKITDALLSKEGSDSVSGLKRFVKGRNRLNISKFLAYLQ